MQWQIDPAHTSVDFAVRHLGISTVRGHFTKLSGTIETTADGHLQSVEATIGTGSIDTREEERNAHLRSADFLDAARNPAIVFDAIARPADCSPQGMRRKAVIARNHPPGCA
jgi:polyisoprenoid-binding protein YceI